VTLDDQAITIVLGLMNPVGVTRYLGPASRDAGLERCFGHAAEIGGNYGFATPKIVKLGANSAACGRGFRAVLRRIVDFQEGQVMRRPDWAKIAWSIWAALLLLALLYLLFYP
jgi:hypothetical protein